MAALAYTAAIQERIGSLLGLGSAASPGYAGSTASNKKLIDATWTVGAVGGQAGDALSYIQQVGQYFALDTPANVPDTWAAWLVARTVMMAGRQIHPERAAEYEKANEEAELAAIDAFDPNAITYDPGATSPIPATLTVQNIRYFVVSHCVRRQRWETVEGARRLRPRLWPQFAVVDHQIERVLRNLWSRADWPFRRRAVTLTITPYAVTAATYTHASKTITKTAGFAAAIVAGATCLVTSGTGAALGEYIVASATADAVVLTTSIGSAADGQTDIACTVVNTTLVGLASETFHSVASREFCYSDSTGLGSKLLWAKDGTAMSAFRARDADGTNTGRPGLFRFENNAGLDGSSNPRDVFAWTYTPIPDTAYSAKGEVYVKGPSLTSLSATTAAMARFPVEFDHVIKTRVLGEVLWHYGDQHGKELIKDSETEVDTLLPRYCDVGQQDDEQEVRDVYGDYAPRPRGAFAGWGWGGTFGGNL